MISTVKRILIAALTVVMVPVSGLTEADSSPGALKSLRIPELGRVRISRLESESTRSHGVYSLSNTRKGIIGSLAVPRNGGRSKALLVIPSAKEGDIEFKQVNVRLTKDKPVKTRVRPTLDEGLLSALSAATSSASGTVVVPDLVKSGGVNELVTAGLITTLAAAPRGLDYAEIFPSSSAGGAFNCILPPCQPPSSPTVSSSPRPGSDGGNSKEPPVACVWGGIAGCGPASKPSPVASPVPTRRLDPSPTRTAVPTPSTQPTSRTGGSQPRGDDKDGGTTHGDGDCDGVAKVDVTAVDQFGDAAAGVMFTVPDSPPNLVGSRGSTNASGRLTLYVTVKLCSGVTVTYQASGSAYSSFQITPATQLLKAGGQYAVRVVAQRTGPAFPTPTPTPTSTPIDEVTVNVKVVRQNSTSPVPDVNILLKTGSVLNNPEGATALTGGRTDQRGEVTFRLRKAALNKYLYAVPEKSLTSFVPRYRLWWTETNESRVNFLFEAVQSQETYLLNGWVRMTGSGAPVTTGTITISEVISGRTVTHIPVGQVTPGFYSKAVTLASGTQIKYQGLGFDLSLVPSNFQQTLPERGGTVSKDFQAQELGYSPKIFGRLTFTGPGAGSSREGRIVKIKTLPKGPTIEVKTNAQGYFEAVGPQIEFDEDYLITLGNNYPCDGDKVVTPRSHSAQIRRASPQYEANFSVALQDWQNNCGKGPPETVEVRGGEVVVIAVDQNNQPIQGAQAYAQVENRGCGDVGVGNNPKTTDARGQAAIPITFGYTTTPGGGGVLCPPRGYIACASALKIGNGRGEGCTEYNKLTGPGQPGAIIRVVLR